MGLPVVATDVRGCREVVENGVNGFLVELGHVDELTRAITALGENEADRRRFGQASRQIATERFDERKVVEIVLRSYAEAAREKGIRWRLGAEHADVIRPADRGDAPRLARLHVEEIGSGFLSRLGFGFIRLLYDALIDWEEGVVLVADTGQVSGFAAGVVDTGRFYRYFVRRHGFRASVMVTPYLMRPSAVRMAFETLGYGTRAHRAGELLSIAVDPTARGRGVGRSLASALLEEMEDRGLEEVKVVVGADNGTAIRLYESLGFEKQLEIEVHAGERSLEMVWSASA